jgi:hypothetical protein
MVENAGSLRRHAEHCRSLAVAGMSDHLRTILLTMASEFDVQAEAIDSAKLILSKP